LTLAHVALLAEPALEQPADLVPEARPECARAIARQSSFHDVPLVS
jgi:hypothetical protein